MAPLNFLNPVALGTANTASKLSTRIKTDGTALSTGFADPTVDIARTSIARNLSSSSAIQKAVHQSLQSALGLINAALNELLSAREQVDSMKSIIIQAKNAPADVLAGLDNMYQKILKSVQDKLAAATYNGKLLFDGKLNQDVRIGEATTNTMNITLSDLSPDTLNIRHANEVDGYKGGTAFLSTVGAKAMPVPPAAGVGKAIAVTPGLRPLQNKLGAIGAQLTIPNDGAGAVRALVHVDWGVADAAWAAVDANANEVGKSLYTATKAVLHYITGAGAASTEAGAIKAAKDVSVSDKIISNILDQVTGAGAFGNDAREVYATLAAAYNASENYSNNDDSGFIIGVGATVNAALHTSAVDAGAALNAADIPKETVLVFDDGSGALGVAAAGKIVGSTANTLQATTTIGSVVTTGTLALNYGINRTADLNQKTAESIVTNLGKYLDKAITDVRSQQQVANLASTSLSDSIKVAQETADDLGRVDIPTTMADLVNSIKSLQGAVLAQALGGKVADALLELLRSA